MTTSSKLNPWQTALINAVTQPEELFRLLELDMRFLPHAKKAAQLFPLKVTHEFISRMEKGNINDPLLQQILPLAAEHDEYPDFIDDPLQEKDVNPVPGLLHKYHGRVLLILTGACAVNCRFCFRRHFPYADNNPGKPGWGALFDYINQDPTISEVILSGGDPLIMGDSLLRTFAQELAKAPHVKRLRIHSRLPIVLPERLTTEFIDWLTGTRLKPILVVHCNHSQEINATVRNAMRSLSGITLLNQTVLLKGINDSAARLIALSEALFEAGVLPYYLNQLDKVRGAAHFEVPVATAKALHWQMVQKLPGYLVPKLVYEGPKAPAKMALI